jgi:hypothetical protein
MVLPHQHYDPEQVRALLGHGWIDATQVSASMTPPQLTRALAFYEENATRLLTG